MLGPSCRPLLVDTRAQLAFAGRADVRSVEAGTSRVRFEDALRARPELTAVLHAVAHSARVGFAHFGGHRPRRTDGEQSHAFTSHPRILGWLTGCDAYASPENINDDGLRPAHR